MAKANSTYIALTKLVYISPQQCKHILDGDLTGGGHGAGRGIPGKREFPARWGDARTIAYIGLAE